MRELSIVVFIVAMYVVMVRCMVWVFRGGWKALYGAVEVIGKMLNFLIERYEITESEMGELEKDSQGECKGRKSQE